jgi:hypothetical protein
MYARFSFAWLFWIGFLVLLATNAAILAAGARLPARLFAAVALLGTAMMFVGSKLGREFLGIAV